MGLVSEKWLVEVEDSVEFHAVDAYKDRQWGQ